MVTLTPQQEAILAIVPKITAAIGFPSAVLLTFLIVMDHRHGKGTPMLRALLGVSIFEGLDAMAWFLSTWCAPYWTDFAFASGTIATCEFQGFWLQFVVGAPMCNCLLAYYFYQVAVYDRTANDIAGMEKYLLGGIVGYATITSFLLLGLKQYNHIGAVCWVIGSPPDCGNSIYKGGDELCERGDWAWLYGMVLFYIPLWICILLIIFYNIGIYRTLAGSGEAHWFAIQSFLYAVAFCVTWAPSTTWSGMMWNGGGGFPLDLASAICEPLAAFWNLLIFLRNRPNLRAKIFYYLCCCPADLDVESYSSQRELSKAISQAAQFVDTEHATASEHNVTTSARKIKADKSSERETSKKEHVDESKEVNHTSSRSSRSLRSNNGDDDDDDEPLAARIKKLRDEKLKAALLNEGNAQDS
jgi:hypothetical protein